MTLRKQLSQMILDLQVGIMKMINMVKESFEIYSQTLHSVKDLNKEGRNELISKIKTNHSSVYSLGEALESESVKILSLQAPVSRDLRTVLSSFRMIYDIQRISKDTSHSFVGLTSYVEVNLESFIDQKELFIQSINAAHQMLNIFGEIYERKVGERTFEYDQHIERTEALDDVIDDLFENHSKNIIKDANSGAIDPESAHKLLAAIRSLERVGDHCCNIIERAIYIKSGDKVHVE